MNKTKIVLPLIFSLILVWIVSSYYLNNNISSLDDEYIKKIELKQKLENLENKWSEKVNQKNITSFEKFLSIQGVSFTKKQNDEDYQYGMILNKNNMDSTINYLLNKNIIIRNIDIKRIDKFTADVNIGLKK